MSTYGRDDLAAKVRWVARDDGDGAGLLTRSSYLVDPEKSIYPVAGSN